MKEDDQGIKTGSPQAREDHHKRMAARQASTLEELLDRYASWLYLEPADFEAIEVTLAAALDRELPGDPVWLMLIAPSGGVKTEVLRSLSQYPKAYTLDSLTANTLASGLTRMNRDTKEMEYVGGILRALDGRVLVIKDFTTILSTVKEARTTIYGQLRAAYDGYFEKGYGTKMEPLRIRATFGLVAGVTPAIDKYTRMASALGERFLSVRSSPNPLKAARRARENVGQEAEMRAQISSSVASMFKTLEESQPPQVSEDQAEEIIRIGYYIALMRSRPWIRYYQGDIVDMDVAEPEIPTRVSKQLSKLAQLLAVLRGHEDVETSEMATLRRVARDTVPPKRQRIISTWSKLGVEAPQNVSDITGRTQRLHYKTVRNETEIMEVLGVLEQDDAGNFRPTALFRELLDVVIPTPPSGVTSENKPKSGSFSELPPEQGIGIQPSRGAEAPTTTTLQERMDRMAFIGRRLLRENEGHPVKEPDFHGVVEEELGIEAAESQRLLEVLIRDERVFRPTPYTLSFVGWEVEP